MFLANCLTMFSEQKQTFALMNATIKIFLRTCQKLNIEGTNIVFLRFTVKRERLERKNSPSKKKE